MHELSMAETDPRLPPPKPLSALTSRSLAIQSALCYSLYDGIGFMCRWVDATYAGPEPWKDLAYSQAVGALLKVYGIDVSKIGKS